MQTFEPRKSEFKLETVQCASCGAVVGVMDYYNLGAELQEIKKSLEKIGKKIGTRV